MNLKLSLAVCPGDLHVAPFSRPTMTKRPFLSALLALSAVLAGGCSALKKPAKPVENPSIAGATEDSMRQRWIDKRTAELVAQGGAPEAARAQATQEFREKYPYMGAAQK
jgi:hypothetical protein